MLPVLGLLHAGFDCFFTFCLFCTLCHFLHFCVTFAHLGLFSPRVGFLTFCTFLPKREKTRD